MSSPPDAPREIEHLAHFCETVLTAETGGPLHLHDFQRTMLADLFDGIRETLVLIPKKNGKSTILAALGLYHLLTTPDAECIIVAASRDQAGIMLRQAAGFIRRSPALQERLTVFKREISHKTLGGRIRILASDSDTLDGVIPTLGLIDELHRHRTDEVYGLIRDGLGPRDGKMVTISTAGSDEESPLGHLRRGAYALPGMERDGAYHRASSPGFVMHEWALEPDADRDDISLVKLANPAPWQTVKELTNRRNSTSMRDWQWARFACGVWLAGEETAISDKEWRACAVEGLQIPAGVPGVYVGIDLGWKHDYTALVPVWKPDGSEAAQVHPPAVLRPPGDGTSLSEEEIWEVVEAMADRWPEVTFVLDPEAGGEQLAQRMERELNVRQATHSQKNAPMCLAAQRLSEAIAAKRLQHPDDEELNRHVLAAAARPVGEGWRFSKQKKKDLKIDAVIALSMAHSVLIAEPPSGGNDGYFL